MRGERSGGVIGLEQSTLPGRWQRSPEALANAVMRLGSIAGNLQRIYTVLAASGRADEELLIIKGERSGSIGCGPFHWPTTIHDRRCRGTWSWRTHASPPSQTDTNEQVIVRDDLSNGVH